jgi:hypothetical protein
MDQDRDAHGLGGFLLLTILFRAFGWIIPALVLLALLNI